MKATFTGAGPTTTQSFRITDPGSHWQTQSWTLYVSGTPGATGSMQLQVSPDMAELPDAQCRWFNSGTAVTTAPTVTNFVGRFRKVRFAFTGGDGTTNLIAEVV